MNGSPSAACAGNSSLTLKSLNERPALRTNNKGRLETKSCGSILRRKEERNTLEEGPVLTADGQRTACLVSVLPVCVTRQRKRKWLAEVSWRTSPLRSSSSMQCGPPSCAPLVVP
ncbi:hypothetical protein PFLUV_G00019950 [Perca fluviatilis]|uniref:Uncharacterized protein n=1 Tax=Perca fluviatilis TaxID=8168 RepID=A0A6A5FPY6_PERFL|nr:hypothetical protein PFLUV_G00019950 [Perca fluviatilis]